MSTTVYSAEVQFAGYSDSSRNGPRVTLRLQDRDDLKVFIGLEGARFMLCLARINDDETLVEEPPKPPAATEPSAVLKGGQLAALAGQFAASLAFQGWVESITGAPRDGVSRKDLAATFIRTTCGVTSRAHLDHNDVASAAFHANIRAPYMKFCSENA